MVINMDEFQLRTIEQIEQFLDASAQVAFTAESDEMNFLILINRYFLLEILQYVAQFVTPLHVRNRDSQCQRRDRESLQNRVLLLWLISAPTISDSPVAVAVRMCSTNSLCTNQCLRFSWGTIIIDLAQHKSVNKIDSRS
jgi:hypothetical protein